MSARNRGSIGPILTAALTLALAGPSASADTITWTGAGDGTTWGQASNWDLGRVPTTTDDVVIPDVAGTTIVVIASDASFGSLTCAENLRLTGGNFYVWGNGTVNADFEFLGGKVYGSDNSTTLTVNGLFRWNCSTTHELWFVTLVAAGSVELSGAGWKQLYGATFVIDGPGTIADGGISIGAYPLQLGFDADLHVLTSGVQLTGSGGISIEGTLALDSDVSATVSNTTISASGTLQVSDSGTLTMAYAKTLTSSGTIDLADNAVLSGPISLNDTASVTGTGTLRITASSYFNGTHQIDAGVDVPAATNLYLYIYGATTINGPFTMASGVNVNGPTGAELMLNGPSTMNGGNMGVDRAIANGPVTVTGDWGVGFGVSVFEHRGRLDWTGGNIGIWYENTLRTAASGEFHAYVNGGGLGHVGTGGISTYDNQGLCVIESGASILTGIGMQFGSSGPLDIGAATLTVYRATISGDVSIGAGGMLMVDNIDTGLAFGGDADITGAGTLRVADSHCTFYGTHEIWVPVEHVGGNLYVDGGTAAFNGPYSHTASNGWFGSSNGGTAIVNGDLTWTGAHLGGDGTIILNGNTTADFPTGDYWCWLFGTLINHGVFTQTGWLRICGGGTFINEPGDPNDPNYLPGQHWLYGDVSCCTYSCGGYHNNGGALVMGPGSSIAFPPGSKGDGGGDKDAERTYTQTSGSTVLNGATLIAGGGVNLQGGSFYGNGAIEGDVVSAASFAPGLSPGQINIAGTYTQNAPGDLAIEIVGPVPGVDYDVLTITDSTTLAGSLTVTLDPNYDPPVGAAFDILTADAPGNAISGTFDPASLPPLTGGKRWALVYETHAVRLSVFLAGDMNCDGVVNNQDIDGFVLALFNPAGYAQQYPDCNILNGDFTGDGFVNNQDIDGFVTALFGS